MTVDERAAAVLLEASKTFIIESGSRLPSHTGGNLLLFSLFFVGHCARQVGFSVEQIDLFIAYAADSVRQRTGKDPTAAIQKTLGTLGKRSLAHAFEQAISHGPPTQAWFEGLSIDILDLAHERQPTDVRIKDIAEFLRCQWFAIQERLTRPATK